MEEIKDDIKLEYNTSRDALGMYEYGRNVQNMVRDLKAIPEKDKRTTQAMAIIKVMELLNPQVRSLEDYEHKLWDHLYMIAGYDLDVDSPYPCPVKEEFETKPVPLPMKGTRIKASHYGRNIERIMDLIASEPEGEVKTALIRSLAIYMRQQYLIWNKDSVADETIFKDIEKLSDYRIRVPEGISLTKINDSATFARPGMSINVGGTQQNAQNRNRNWVNKKNRRPNNRKK